MMVSLTALQSYLERTFGEKDKKRGIDGTFMWFMEEVGELATALREGTQKNKEEEFADVMAWLATLANLAGINLEKAFQEKYIAHGCSKCGTFPCVCGSKP